MAKVENQAPDLGSETNGGGRWWHIKIRYENVGKVFCNVIIILIAVLIVLYIEKAIEARSDSLQEIEHLKTNLLELNNNFERVKQENEELKQKIKSQSEIIATLKEAKERESEIRDHVQKNAEDMRTKLYEMHSDYGNLKQKNEWLTRENNVQSEKTFIANEELNDYKTRNWWHWIFEGGLIIVVILFSLVCCMCGGPDRRPLLRIAN